MAQWQPFEVDRRAWHKHDPPSRAGRSSFFAYGFEKLRRRKPILLGGTMDFGTAMAYIAIVALIVVNALIVRRMKIVIRDDNQD
jgi:hypothetical protein